MPPVVTSDEWLEIANNTATAMVPFPTPAWCVTNMIALYGGPGVRGSNRVIPGAAGVLALPRRATETQVSLELVVSGSHDLNGVAYGDPCMGVRLNLRYLVVNLVSPGTAATRAAVLHLPDGVSTLGAQVQVLGPLQPARAVANHARATIDLLIPAGSFT